MNAKTVFSLLCCACVCAGCADGELGMTHQECEQRMIGKDELSMPRPESDLMPYKDLEIMSNNVFSCSCRVNGEWVCKEGYAESSYILFSPWHNRHGWGNCRSE